MNSIWFKFQQELKRRYKALHRHSFIITSTAQKQYAGSIELQDIID